MSQPNQTNFTPDDSLADFADRVLDGKTSTAEARADDELRGLEETILRLKGSLPQEAPDAKTIRRMQANFRARVRKADSPTIPVWQFLRPRQPQVWAFAAVAFALFLIVLPFLTSMSGSTVEGTAGLQPREWILLAGGVCVIGLLIWARRRK